LLGQRYPQLKIYGHDQSAFLIELARERAAQIDPQAAAIPKFSVGDCRNVPLGSDLFDFVMVMGNSFGYFSANDKRDEDEDYGM
jgi:ubiquinone/menaquinone biosynthesis C-methylase UbiE